jgi:hypothetical protein
MDMDFVLEVKGDLIHLEVGQLHQDQMEDQPLQVYLRLPAQVAEVLGQEAQVLQVTVEELVNMWNFMSLLLDPFPIQSVMEVQRVLVQLLEAQVQEASLSSRKCIFNGCTSYKLLFSITNTYLKIEILSFASYCV